MNLVHISFLPDLVFSIQIPIQILYEIWVTIANIFVSTR